MSIKVSYNAKYQLLSKDFITMPRLVKIAIVGRPNVGKSALFNCICKKRTSIVDEQEGVTRDRIYATTEAFGYPFELIDTGGIDSRSQDIFAGDIRRQAEIAIEEADSIIMVVDAKVGPAELDRDVAKILHRTNKPICLAVNKVDNFQNQEIVHEFACLGIPRMIPVSASHGLHIAELIEASLEKIPKEILEEESEPEPELPRIAIVGRPNVGKSALVNSLSHDERCIVSPIAGTTRDSIDTKVEINGHEYILVDTAGIRRKHKEKEVVEKFASLRTIKAIDRADICLLVMDATQGITSEEKKIARLIEEAEKGCILLFNKWDLVKGFRMEHCLQAVEQEVPFLKHCPKIFISAKTGRNLDKVFPAIQSVIDAHSKRITTGILNKNLMAAMQKYHPPVIGGKRLRIYYMAQVDTKPPRFVLFVNSPHLMDEGYKRYLVNGMREIYNFEGVPIKLTLRGKEENKKKAQKPPEKSRHIDRDFTHLAAQDEEHTLLHHEPEYSEIDEQDSDDVWEPHELDESYDE